MKGAHVAGGGLGALLGLVVATALRRYAGWHVSDADASLIGSAAVAAGAGLGHVWTTVGLIPAVRRGVFGPPKAKTPEKVLEAASAVLQAPVVTAPQEAPQG